MATDKRIVLQLTAENEKLRRKLLESKNTINTWSKQVKNMFASAFAAIGVTQLVRSFITLRSEFSKTLSYVFALTKATMGQRKELVSLAKELGATTVYTASQAGEAMQVLAQAGLDVNQVLTATPQILALAQAGNLSLARSADVAVQTMYQFGKEVTDLTHITDVLANVAARTNTNVDEFSEGFKMAGPLAKAAGMSLEEAAAAMGILANAGLKGTVGGTGLRAVIASLIAPSRQAREKIKDLGVSIADSTGKLRPLSGIFKDLITAEMTASDAAIIFRRTGVAAAISLANNAGKIDTMTEAVNESGTAMFIAKERADNLWGSIKLLESAWENLNLTIGDDSNSILRTLVEELVKATWAVTAFIGAFKDFDWLHPISGFLDKYYAIYNDLYKKGVPGANVPGAGMGPQPQGAVPIPWIEGNVTGISEVDTDVDDILNAIGKQAKNTAKILREDFEPVFYDLFGDDGLLSRQAEEMGGLFNLEAGKKFAESLSAPMESASAAYADLINQQETLKGNIQSIGSVITDMFDNFAAAFTEGENGLKKFWDYFKKWALGMLLKIIGLIAAAIALNILLGGMLIKKGLATTGETLPYILKLIGGGGISNMGKGLGIKGFATGTPFVPQDQLAYVHRGEAIIPANQNRMGMGQVEFVIRGRDLYGTLNKFEQTRGIY